MYRPYFTLIDSYKLTTGRTIAKKFVLRRAVAGQQRYPEYFPLAFGPASKGAKFDDVTSWLHESGQQVFERKGTVCKATKPRSVEEQ